MESTPDNPLIFSKYAFVFAHPDDEMYTCAFSQSLVRQGKEVHVIYATSGDYEGADFAAVREQEVRASMDAIGVPQENIHFLRIPERELMARVSHLRQQVLDLVGHLRAECVITHDFETGHNMHDAVSFCASKAAESLQLPLYMFPAYHIENGIRVFNTFVPSHQESYALPLSSEQQELKRRMAHVHLSQARFFAELQGSADSTGFYEREILRRASLPIDFATAPASVVGYEYATKGKITFEDFKRAIKTEG